MFVCYTQTFPSLLWARSCLGLRPALLLVAPRKLYLHRFNFSTLLALPLAQEPLAKAESSVLCGLLTLSTQADKKPQSV